MSASIAVLLLSVGLSAVPDLPPPLGNLQGVLEAPQDSSETGREFSFPSCSATHVNVSRFVAGAAFALQQMVEWSRQVPGLTVFPAGALEEVTVGITEGKFVERRACASLPSEVAKAPKLCSGTTDQAWMLANEKPVALVRWAPSAGKDKCAPKLVATFFDKKGIARAMYEADFGAKAAGELLGGKCRVSFKWDTVKEVFRPKLQGCKGS